MNGPDNIIAVGKHNILSHDDTVERIDCKAVDGCSAGANNCALESSNICVVERQDAHNHLQVAPVSQL